MIAEKRKYTRFVVRPDTYAALGSCFTKVGKVRQISVGGLAFDYICIMESQERHPNKIALFLCEDGFFLPDLPCRVISNLPDCHSNGNEESGSICAVNRS